MLCSAHEAAPWLDCHATPIESLGFDHIVLAVNDGSRDNEVGRARGLGAEAARRQSTSTGKSATTWAFGVRQRIHPEALAWSHT